MSFVTVFTAGAMGFVLLAPVLMVSVLVFASVQLRRPSALEESVTENGTNDVLPAPATLSRAA
ncbi:hypothetical protein FB382_003964 [Nocardioides ginsengisegetis]|uniref:Uncharacterized protein n=1 Tax=Nocardioides ginsengisegetis TaxID=661491 RepID=A0A7W3PBN5_9ACTN|nr:MULTISPECIES: hypothetical protein [Nocardioides]MBA8805619.1 hypothetical protein [Nocardioides ginsengisegetis]GCD90119.1 hypothetical protein NLS1_21250 [Nocardioides sp. LS1]